jgi:hypothetical protein
MKTRWLFSADKNEPVFYVTGNIVYAHPGGEASFTISNGLIYASTGKPVYRIDGDRVLDHPGGSPAFCFRD